MTVSPITPFFAWSDDYALGREPFDEHHRGLVGLIDRLYTRMSEGRGGEGAAEVVRALARYAAEHFAMEEAHMRRLGVERFAAHRKEHAELVDRVAAALVRLDAGEGVSTLDLAGFLRDWLARHILKTDRELVETLRRENP